MRSDQLKMGIFILQLHREKYPINFLLLFKKFYWSIFDSKCSIKFLLYNKVTQSCFYYSVAKPCPSLWDPMDAACLTSLSFTISRNFLKFTFIELVMLSSHLILCCLFSFSLQSFPASGSFPISKLFTSGG